uniref:CCHC-type domain-containing protein n=1 Tax=Ditylenchus dipsaci TaxID=166011 RepID=A0A915CSU7_9BILA
MPAMAIEWDNSGVRGMRVILNFWLIVRFFAGGSGAGCSICQICRQEDHLTNDCPDAHSGYQECEHCGQVDHATENCPHHAHLDDGSDGGAA